MITPARSSWSYAFAPIVAIVLLMTGVWVLYLQEANQITVPALDRENRRMEILSGQLSRDVDETVSDLRQLATGDGIETYLTSGQASDLERATRRAAFFSKDDANYDQVRYIDEKGQEMVRINFGGVIVPKDQLQNKADRYYFKRGAALGPDEIYISKIDLNVEHGEIEQPIKPMIRLAAPVFDAAGNRRGFYIINVLASNIIHRLRYFAIHYPHRFRLLNSQGYWIAGASPEEEWGFMFPNRADQTLAKTDPELWAKIVQSPSGQVPYHGGYFTWSRISPAELDPGKPVKLVADDDFLVFASVLSADEWNGMLVALRETFLAVAAVLLILAGAIGWIYRARRLAQQERDRFFSLTRDMLCVAAFDGTFRRVNPAWEKALGYSPLEMIGRPFLDFVHPDDRQKTVLQTASLASGGEVLSFENRYICKDGTYRWLLWSARSLTSERLIYGSARDMTERKQIEEKLRLSEERLRQMVESVQDYAIFMLDPAGRVMNWNAGAERIMGYSVEEIVGKHFSQFYPEEKKLEKFPDQELIEAAEQDRSEDENWRVRKNGSRFWANTVITAVRNQLGELIGFVKVTRDVSARKEAEERIQKLNEELSQRADLLGTANKELESFSYSVSHDLRAPLRHIHGFVELLQKTPALETDKSAQRYMGVISKAAKEMGMLIDDLLAFSRTGRAEMNPVKINMREMVDGVIRDQEMDLKDRKVTWDIKPLPTAMGDPGLIRLVWTNLIGNAIKYSRPREEAKIEIGEFKGDAGKPGVREAVYFIRDNGVGFDMQYTSKLFGVFQRLHRSEDFEGTGIGLANVQRIIHRHGGRVWAEGQVDAGATFYFSLPVNLQPGQNHGL